METVQLVQLGCALSSDRVTHTVFSTGLHRIEVHAGGVTDAERDMVWSVTATRAVDASILLWGYLRIADGGGFGQAQVVASGPGNVTWSAAIKNKATRSELTAWVAEHAAEAMFDTARRALQAQAATMDFYFEVDNKAPEVDLEIEIPEKSNAKSKAEIGS